VAGVRGRLERARAWRFQGRRGGRGAGPAGKDAGLEVPGGAVAGVQGRLERSADLEVPGGELAGMRGWLERSADLGVPGGELAGVWG
jgi:hypothetical protein